MESLEVLWRRAVHPAQGFRDRARERPSLRDSVMGMLLLRVPLAFVGSLFAYVSFASLYARLASPQSEVWTLIASRVPEAFDPAELDAVLARMPALPDAYRMVPWLALLAPLAVLSLWLHDAAFDHMGLWLLRGLGERRGLRASLSADAEALKVGALGAAAGLLAEVPGAGAFLGLLLFPVAVYFWVLRGYALAAWHGCPPWKGVVATLLNVVLAGAMILMMLLACLVMVILLI